MSRPADLEDAGRALVPGAAGVSYGDLLARLYAVEALLVEMVHQLARGEDGVTALWAEEILPRLRRDLAALRPLDYDAESEDERSRLAKVSR